MRALRGRSFKADCYFIIFLVLGSSALFFCIEDEMGELILARAAAGKFSETPSGAFVLEQERDFLKIA